MDPVAVITICMAIGLAAGVVGGMAGIGGSIIMLPALAIVFGFQSETKAEQHLYQAAAMWVNVVVAWASSRRHQAAGVHDPKIRRALLPGLIGGVIIGVMVSDQLQGVWLKTTLVVFLFAYCLLNAVTALTGIRVAKNAPTGTEPYNVTHRRRLSLGIVGTLTGLPAGILGIGGGIVMIPIMQVWTRVPLKRAIAASASVMWISAIIGATLKVWTLPMHDQPRLDVPLYAAPMAFGAFFGSRIGAFLTHRLRLPFLKLAISAVLAIAGLRLVGII